MITINLNIRLTFKLLLAALALCPLVAAAQTLTITNGVQTYSALTNTTVTMTGRSELRVTATTNPVPGCVINLNSSNAWLMLTGVKPSVVVANNLGQIFVNGAAAVADSNVRVVQYGAGSVVIPHPPAFQPLQVFSGPHFSGAAQAYSQYIYYTGTGLGSLDLNISSFKLKRGYMAVLAQNTSGNGVSKCYVAQDADLEISVLPASLDNKIRFLYVTPWRWVSKKGIAGNIENGLNVAWKYNWDINQNSSRDWEYVPIRAKRYWPDLVSQNWNTLDANTVLGYNEPDKTDQANILVGDAIYSWPDLLGTGLRVGSPAVSDGGRSAWLYPFIQQADAAGLRVDFVAIHYYQCVNPADPAGAATQLYNFLKATYDQVKRPLWVTEWNNGANWTGCGDPTYAQQQAAVAQMINLLETTPFVERYSIYNWVEDVRAVVDTNGVITSAGVTYRDKVSALSYVQTVPDNETRSLAQFLFETNTLDSSGYGNNGLAFALPSYTNGHSGQAVVLDGTNNFVQLPPNIASSNSFTFAAWVYWNGGGQWQRIFDFGDDTLHYLFLTPSSGSGTLRFAIRNGGAEQLIETSPLPVGQWRHVAITLSGSSAKLYTNGVLAVSSTTNTIVPSNFNPNLNYLGKSQFAADPLFRGKLDDVLVADYAFTPAQIAALQTNLPPQFTTNLITGTNAPQGQAYAGSLAGAATDPNPGNTLTYSKAAGPSWLVVAANGTLTGTPGTSDTGTNSFTVRVTDTAGASAFALLTIKVTGLLNAGFETPTTSTYLYNPSGGAWAFSAQSGANGSGITANNSAFSSGNPNAPEGAQCAFLQGSASISQAVSPFVPGAKYNVTFAAALRALNLNGGQTWSVKIDSTVMANFSPAVNATNYVDYSTNFSATAATHTLRFVGTDLHGGDNTVFLDNVRLTFVSPPNAPNAPANLQAVAGDGRVALSWNAATYATGYNVKRSTTSGSGYVTNASPTTTSYTDTNVANGTTYYYAVSAVNSGGEGTNSTEVAALPVSTAALSLDFTAGESGLLFNWPADHRGWRLMMNTNSLDDSNGWTAVLNSSVTNQLWIPFDPAQGNVFFRLIYP